MSSEFPEPFVRWDTFASSVWYRTKNGRYRIEGTECGNCGEKFFPPRTGLICPACHAREMKPYQCAHSGQIVTLAPDDMGFPAIGYGDYLPRQQAIIRAEDQNVGACIQYGDRKQEGLAFRGDGVACACGRQVRGGSSWLRCGAQLQGICWHSRWLRRMGRRGRRLLAMDFCGRWRGCRARWCGWPDGRRWRTGIARHACLLRSSL